MSQREIWRRCCEEAAWTSLEGNAALAQMHGEGLASLLWLRLRLRFPLLLFDETADWRQESRVTVTGFTLFWLLAEFSQELLGHRRGDLQAMTLDHFAPVLGSTQWWYCAILLSGMSAAALWVSCATDGSFGEAVQRFEKC